MLPLRLSLTLLVFAGRASGVIIGGADDGAELPLPRAERVFVVSPPPSPPLDWQPREEDAPCPPPPVRRILFFVQTKNLFGFFINKKRSE